MSDEKDKEVKEDQGNEEEEDEGDIKLPTTKEINAEGEEIEIIDLPPIEYENRKCTDVLCLLLFIWFVAVDICFVLYAFSEGNGLLLLYGTDNVGNLCGDGNLTGSRFLALPRLTEDIEEAELLSIANGDLSSISDIDFFGVCVDSCPQEGDFVCSIEAEDALVASGLDRENTIASCLQGATCDVDFVQDECFLTIFNTTSFLFRCLPEFIFEVETIAELSGCVQEITFVDDNGETQTRCARFRTVEQITVEEPPDSNVISDTFNTVGRQLDQIASDLVETRFVVGGVGLGYSFFASILYVSLLWVFVGPVVWGSVFAIIVLCIAFTSYLYAKAGFLNADAVDELLQELDQNLLDLTGDNLDFNLTDQVDLAAFEDNVPAVSTSFQQQYEIAAYVATAISGLIILILFCSFGKIARAIKFFKEASHVLRANFGLLCFPPCVASCVLLNGLWFVLGLAYTKTIGDIEINELNFSATGDQVLTSSEFVSVSYSDAMAILLFFGYLWITQVIIGLSTMMISHVITQSYWNTEQGTMFYKRGSFRRAIVEVLRFHIGSVAFGALLIAIVQLIRALAAYIDHQTKKIQEKNRIVRYAMKSVHCLLWCFEKCMKYASKNAFIITGMYGTSFCTSSVRAFFAILKNLAQVSTVQFFGEIIVRFGQILVTVSAGLFAVALLDVEVSAASASDAVDVASVVPAILIVMVMGFVISGGVLNIYDVAVDTLMLSYILDKKRLKQRGEEYKQRKQSQAGEGKTSFTNLMEEGKSKKRRKRKSSAGSAASEPMAVASEIKVADNNI